MADRSSAAIRSLWELAAKPDLTLVSGDKLLLQHADMAGRVLTPLAFCDAWPAS